MTPAALLAALQLGDSAFPSGAFTQSYGLEALVAEGAVTCAADVEAVLADHLRRRLARADLPSLLAAHQAAVEGDVERVARIDHALTAVKMTREERQGARPVGAPPAGGGGRRAGHPTAAACG